MWILGLKGLTVSSLYNGHLAPVQKVDSTINRINLYPVISAIGFQNTYPLDSDLSGG